MKESLKDNVRAIGTLLKKIKSGSEVSDWTIGSLNSIGEVSTERGEIDVTTHDSPDRAKEYMAGEITAGDVSFSGITKTKDDEQTIKKMMALLGNGSVEKFEVVYPSGSKWAFNAYVKSFKTSEATVEGLVGFSGAFKVSGLPVFTPKE